jgi:hypothetical protein
MLQTEFEFRLPMGYVDGDGNIHRDGIMRLATAMDEIAPMRDPRVKANEAYLTVILLSRVISRLGTLRQINPGIIENLFSADLMYLQDLYRQINEHGHNRISVVCPGCERHFEWENAPLGG